MDIVASFSIVSTGTSIEMKEMYLVIIIVIMSLELLSKVGCE